MCFCYSPLVSKTEHFFGMFVISVDPGIILIGGCVFPFFFFFAQNKILPLSHYIHGLGCFCCFTNAIPLGILKNMASFQEDPFCVTKKGTLGKSVINLHGGISSKEIPQAPWETELESVRQTGRSSVF